MNINNKFRDSHLSELGISQATEAQEVTDQLKIHTVFVSPLRRTLETAYHIFKTHPNFKMIKFIVVPNLRESMNTISDIPENVDDVKAEFTELIPQLDYSLLKQCKNKYYYYIENMPKEIQRKIAKDIDLNPRSPYIDPAGIISELIKGINPKKMEGNWNSYDRT